MPSLKSYLTMFGTATLLMSAAISLARGADVGTTGGLSVVLDAQTPRGKLLAASGLAYENSTDPLAVIQAGKAQVLVLDATAKNLQALTAHPELVQQFTQKGGWLFVWGVTPETLADFNKLVGVEHVLRPFRRERVALTATPDPLMSGFTQSDISMESSEQIAFSQEQYYPATDEFTYIVDYDDIAPFCHFPDWQYFYPDRKEMGPDNDPLNMVNGFVTADGWWYTFSLYPGKSKLEFDLTLPRQEATVQIDIVPNRLYQILNQLDLTYDGDTQNMVHVKLDPLQKEAAVTLPDKQVKILRVKLAGWEANGNPPSVVGIDNFSLKVKRSPEFYARVKPLLNIGGLMKYPQGQGGVVLCQLNVPKEEQAYENVPKRQRILTVLLRHLGAVLSGDKNQRQTDNPGKQGQ